MNHCDKAIHAKKIEYQKLLAKNRKLIEQAGKNKRDTNNEIKEKTKNIERKRQKRKQEKGNHK